MIRFPRPSEYQKREPGSVDIGLVNNMQPAAIKSTERQFCSLLNAASQDIPVRVSLYALSPVPAALEGYSSIESVRDRRLDGLIITGREPVARSLREEPYWNSLSALLEWAEHNTRSSIWSCLAAHAAVLRMDGIERCPLREKLSGIFDTERLAADSGAGKMTIGIPESIQMPHSRWNALPESALKACGYCCLTRSREAGTDIFAKQRKSLFLFFQGHLEYEAETLLFEYRRDIRRFLRRETDVYPSMPRGYFGANTAGMLTGFKQRAVSERREELLGDFPAAVAGTSVSNTWRPAAIALYRNWLQYLRARKWAERTPPAARIWAPQNPPAAEVWR